VSLEYNDAGVWKRKRGIEAVALVLGGDEGN
jgi:hypothetical protein